MGAIENLIIFESYFSIEIFTQTYWKLMNCDSLRTKG